LAVSPNNTLGRYRIVREIARSNDIVYEAIDPQMNRRVALKELLLPPHLAGAQKRERIERFYREAKAAGQLTHPNIVTIHEVGQENDRHFIAMEYLEGQSLRDILQMQGALPLRETIEIAIQLCEALSYAHAHGVVHRDVKPDNIHLLPGGVVKLTDFGIARITAEPSITSQGQVFGTPSYMSPEQVASQSVDHRTDIFSLGIALYEMVTGRKPFIGDSVITITYNIMNVQPVMPVGVPPMLQGILQKALAKDPSLRYQNAAALSADLRAQKLELESPPAGHRPTGMTFAPTPAGVMSTGAAPPEISGQPFGQGSGAAPGGPVGGSSHMPGPATEYGLSYPPAEGGRLSPQARSFLGLLASILGIIILLLLLVWGVGAALRAFQYENKQRAAFQMSQDARQALSGGDLDRAATNYQNAQLTAPPGSAAARQATQGLAAVEVARGQHAVAAGNPAAAQAAYQQAIDLDARNAEAYDSQGLLRQGQGDLLGAAQSWEAAIQADPTSPYAADARTNATNVYQTLASQASGAGNVADARRYWQKIMVINPGSNAARQAQAQIVATEPTGSTPSP